MTQLFRNTTVLPVLGLVLVASLSFLADGPAAASERDVVVPASATSFELVMNGFHSAAGPRERFSLGFRHEGPFTATAPFCSSGYAVDLQFVPPIELRQFTCSDGSGSITARKTINRADPLFTHEEGVWTIVAGAGRYATLRGKGTSVNDFVSGDPADHVTTTYREVWQGVIDFDVTRPDVRITQARATRLESPKSAYRIRVVFTARDGEKGNPLSYAMTLSGPRVFVRRSATTTSATVSTAFRVRPKQGARRLQLVLVVSDSVGHEARVARQLRLGR